MWPPIRYNEKDKEYICIKTLTRIRSFRYYRLDESIKTIRNQFD